MPLSLSDPELDRLFPAHFRTDRQGVIRAGGASLRHHLGATIEGAGVLDAFEMLRPAPVAAPDGPALDRLLVHGQAVALRARRVPAIRLQGLVHISGADVYFLLGHFPSSETGPAADSPPVAYTFDDFGPFDGAKELFLTEQIHRALLEDAHELAQALKHEKSIAEAASQAKSQFLACMSHEIRTPLNGVLGLAALLDQTELDTHQQRLLAGLRESGVSLLDLLNDVIELIDGNTLALDREPFRLADLVDTLTAKHAGTFRAKGLDFRVSIAPDLARRQLEGDRRRLAQILGNLLSNALKFTATGHVHLEFREETGPHAGGTVLTARVEDTGIGIGAADRERIFEPFEQADGGITRSFGGPGLGLSIARQLCQMMGGRMTLTSAPGRGSTFAVRLPFPHAAAPPAAAPADLPAPAGTAAVAANR